MEEGEDRCGEMGTVPQKMASGDGTIRAQGGHKGTKQGRGWWLVAWGNRVHIWNCEEKVGISTSLGGAQ